jgi:hypothetical protein
MQAIAAVKLYRALEDNNIKGYIPNFGQYKPYRAGFAYDKQNDLYTCSRGVHLPFKKIQTNSLSYQMRVYRSSSRDYKLVHYKKRN